MLLITFQRLIESIVKIIGKTIQKKAKGGMPMKKSTSTLWGCSKLGVMSQPRSKISVCRLLWSSAEA